ncbi:NEAT domain-containing protein [Convivina intestini]|uniref:NEAT domain-containing protein n=1 Tax=Convivina intestini TaxID=1505726 RepID=UPI002010B68F|nr:NEAT domain-containing protein [Convivina intestini]CAH1854887.1 hypothetical protein R078131_01099 [Convivina intestini]
MVQKETHRVKMFKAGKLWLTAGVTVATLGAVSAAQVNSPAMAAEVTSTASTNDPTQLADGQYQINYAMNESGKTTPSMMQSMFGNPATAVVNGNQITMTFTFNDSMFTTATQLSNMLTSWTFNGVESQKNGITRSVTLDKAALAATIKMDVAYPHHQQADFNFKSATLVKAAPDSTSTASQTSTSTNSDSKAPASTASDSVAPASQSTTPNNDVNKHDVGFQMMRFDDPKTPSVMSKMIAQPAKTFYSADGKNVTMTFSFANSGSAFGNGQALSDMLHYWKFNNVPATKNGLDWTVTLPTQDLDKAIIMEVSYFQVEQARLFMDKMPAFVDVTSLSASTQASTKTSQSDSQSIITSTSLKDSTSLSSSTAGSESQSTSKLASASLSQKVSEQESTSVKQSTSAQESQQTSQSQSKVASDAASTSLSQKVSEQQSDSLSESNSAKQSQSESQSKVVSASTSLSEVTSTKQKDSLSESNSADQSQSQSQSKVASTSVSLSEALSAKQSASVSESTSTSLSQVNSQKATSTSQASDSTASDSQASTSQASDSTASDSQASTSQASDSTASDSQASTSQTSDSTASDSQASTSQASDSTASDSQASTSQSTADNTSVNTHDISYQMLRHDGSHQPSVMSKMIVQPAKLVYSADGQNAALTFKFADSGSSFGNGQALSDMLHYWKFNGVPAKKDGLAWTVTLPTKDLNKMILMEVSYFQIEQAELYLDAVPAFVAPDTPSSNSTSQTPDSTSTNSQGSDSQASTSQASDSTTSDSQASTSQASDSTTSDSQASTSQTSDSMTSDSQASTSQASDSTTSDSQASTSQASDSTTSDSQASTSQASDSTASDSQASTSQASDSTASDSQASTSQASDSTASNSQASQSVAPTSQSTTDNTSVNTHEINYKMIRHDGSHQPSVMAKMIAQPAKLVYSADGQNATLTFSFADSGSSFGNGQALSDMLHYWKFNGVPAQKNGLDWTVTLPTKDLNKMILMEVSYFQTEQAELYLDAVPAFVAPDTPSNNSTSQTPSESTSPASQSTNSQSTASDSQSTSQASTSNSNSTSTSTSITPASQGSDSKSSSTSNSTASESQAPNSQNAKKAIVPGTYAADYSMKKSGTAEPSVMDKMFDKPAKVVISADGKQATLTFTFTQGDTTFGSGDLLANMLKEWTFNGVPAVRDGRNWTVTLPSDALKHVIHMKVTYFQTEEADLYLKDWNMDDDGADSQSPSNVTPNSQSDANHQGSESTNNLPNANGNAQSTSSAATVVDFPQSNGGATTATGGFLPTNTSAKSLPKTSQTSHNDSAVVLATALAFFGISTGASLSRRKK